MNPALGQSANVEFVGLAWQRVYGVTRRRRALLLLEA